MRAAKLTIARSCFHAPMRTAPVAKLDGAPRPNLSIIVPMFNEQESVAPLYRAIVTAVAPLGRAFEMIFVDDGSKDRTVEVATELARCDSRLRIVKFRRNYGQTAAMAAGIDYARGDILITMDGDLQNDPQDIRHFVDKIEEGHDVVVGWRFNRQDKLVSRKIPSRIANKLIAKVTGVSIRDNGCSLKAFKASLIKNIPLYSEMHRFIPAMVSIAGPRLAEIKVRHHARRFGESKYGLSRIYKVLLDLTVIKTIATFASRPLRWFTLLALPLLFGATATFLHIFITMAHGRADLSLPLAGTGVLLLATAVILVLSGALGELIYQRGDLRDREFSRLTQSMKKASTDSDGQEPECSGAQGRARAAPSDGQESECRERRSTRVAPCDSGEG